MGSHFAVRLRFPQRTTRAAVADGHVDRTPPGNRLIILASGRAPPQPAGRSYISPHRGTSLPSRLPLPEISRGEASARELPSLPTSSTTNRDIFRTIFGLSATVNRVSHTAGRPAVDEYRTRSLCQSTPMRWLRTGGATVCLITITHSHQRLPIDINIGTPARCGTWRKMAFVTRTDIGLAMGSGYD